MWLFHSDDGGVTSWGGALQYLLDSYATSTAIRETVLELRKVLQRRNENKSRYSLRLNSAAIHFGSVHSANNKMTLFLDGLHQSIKSLVPRQRDKHASMDFVDLVQFAQP